MGFPKIYQKNLRTVPFDIEDTGSLINGCYVEFFCFLLFCDMYRILHELILFKRFVYQQSIYGIYELFNNQWKPEILL